MTKTIAEYPEHLHAGRGRIYVRFLYGRADFELLNTVSSKPDEKGRAIGWRIRLIPVSYVMPDPSEDHHRTIDASIGYGDFWEVGVQKTRAGIGFGSSQPSKRFDTREEALAWAQKVVAERIKKHEK